MAFQAGTASLRELGGGGENAKKKKKTHSLFSADLL